MLPTPLLDAVVANRREWELLDVGRRGRVLRVASMMALSVASSVEGMTQTGDIALPQELSGKPRSNTPNCLESEQCHEFLPYLPYVLMRTSTHHSVAVAL